MPAPSPLLHSAKPTLPRAPPPRYKVNGVSKIDSVNCSFEIDFKIFVYWTDSFYEGGKKGAKLALGEKGAFNPELEFANESALICTHEEFVLKDPENGSVKLTRYCRGRLNLLSMELQVCVLRLSRPRDQA